MGKNTREIIKELCTARNMSLTDLERALGIGNGTICKWDKAMPNTQKLIAVADYFDVSLDYLVDREVGTNSQKVDTELAQIAGAYETADEVTKEMVRRILGIKKDTRIGLGA